VARNNVVNHENGRANGQIISGDSDLKDIKLDEVKSGGNNKRISVYSEKTNITITPSLDQSITAHLYGICSYSGEPPRLSLTEDSGETKIEVICSADSVFGKIMLDITVPRQKYDNLYALTTSGKVKIENILATRIQVNTKSGDVSINSENDTLIVNTVSGNVVLKGIGSSYAVTTTSGDITPKCHGNYFELITTSGNVKGEIGITSDSSVVGITTTSGNTEIIFSKVSSINLRMKTITGTKRNQFLESQNGYETKVTISSVSGNINVK
jgi:DUF4097 and DUF4098 domain-containing protein YvlB